MEYAEVVKDISGRIGLPVKAVRPIIVDQHSSYQLKCYLCGNDFNVGSVALLLEEEKIPAIWSKHICPDANACVDQQCRDNDKVVSVYKPFE